MKKKLISILLSLVILLMSAYPALATTAGVNNLGVYHWDRQPGQISDFSEWINRPAYLAEDFLLRYNWNALEGESRLYAWQGTPWADKMILAAYPFPDNMGTLPEAAAGNYNSHYYQLGVNLVNAGMSNAVIRFGHEFNGNWYPWSPWNDPNGEAAGELDFAESFRQFVTTLRTVPNQHFSFVWNPAINQWGVNLANAYPGDQYVDVVGIDIYDTSWDTNTYPYQAGATDAEKLTHQQNAWNSNLNNNNWGLKMINDFANQHSKPVGIGEWGLSYRSDGHGGGDDPYFVQQMHDWMSANNVIWNIYFNVNAGDGDADLYDTYKFPSANPKFQQLWNPTGVTPTPRPVTPPTIYPSGTVTMEGETGTFLQTSGTLARPYGNPWAIGKTVAALMFKGAAVQYANSPAASSLMVRYQAPPDGDTYVSVYVDNVLSASHVKFTNIDRTLPTAYYMATIPVTVPSGATVKFQIDPNDDSTLNNVWDSVNIDTISFVPPSGSTSTPTPTPTLTPTPTPTPTSTPTPTLTPTPTPTPTSTPMINTHSGTWSAQGALGSALSWKYMTQWKAVAANTDYTASFWLKGSGNVTLRVLDANWIPITAQTFTATDTWTNRSLTINSGNRTVVGYEFIDNAGGTTGTVYIDDGYLGMSAGGTNLLSNPGFESGNNYQWGGDWGLVFSIVQPAPTATPTPTPTSINNAHSGTWAAQGALGSTASWKYMTQWQAMAANTDYTASYWLKGAGNVTLRVLDTNWIPIAAQTFTATDTWTNQSLIFNSGNRTVAGYEIIDNSGGTASTVYIDDAYLGTGSGGTNLLSNPDFESGNNNKWGGDWGSVFSIVQQASFSQPLDTTSAVTTSNAKASWQKTPQTVTLTATDDSSGVDRTFYSVDSGPFTAGNSVFLNTDGIHMIQYYSVDKAGNQETVKSAAVRIDMTPPVIPVPSQLNFQQSDAVSLNVTAADILSGLKDLTIQLDGKDVANPLSLQVLELAAGDHILQAHASDIAGNVTDATFELKISVDIDQLGDVLQAGKTRGWITNFGVLNSLLSKVDSIKKSGKDNKQVQNGLKALENEVRAQSGKKLDAGFAAILLDDLSILKQAYPVQ